MTEGVARCDSCGVELAPGMLACPACRRLVHADRLKALSAEAEIAEREGRLADALGGWREALDLLPPGIKQRGAVEARIKGLSEAVDRAGGAPAPEKGKGAKVAAGVGAIALLAWKLKFVVISLLGKAKLLLTGLTSLPTLLSMFAWMALDRSRGVMFALGILISIYIHEMGHVAALRRYGIKATAPMFVPGLGALVRLRQYPIDAREDARVGLAGPVWGCAAAVIAFAVGLLGGDKAWLGVASVGALINVFNLIPFWQLDGARGFRALTRKQRGLVLALAAVIGLFSGQATPWLVCAVGAVRLQSDLPKEGDPRAFYTFAGLLVALSAIGWAVSAIG